MTGQARTTAQAAVAENVHIQVHDAEALRQRWPGWDDNPKDVKRRLARRTPPDEEHEHANTTCIGLDEYRVDNLHTGTTADETASHLAVGTGTDTPSYGDRSLTSEAYRTPITDGSANGTDLFTSTFLDTSEANGTDIEEVGLVTSASGGSDILLNHSLIETITKTNQRTATIDVTLSFDTA